MTDAELIKLHGGPSKLAKKLGWTQQWAVHRISNWKRRGIPASIKLQFPEVFLLHLQQRPPESAECTLSGGGAHD